jgi:hypothetical protein
MCLQHIIQYGYSTNNNGDNEQSKEKVAEDKVLTLYRVQ